MLNLSEASVKRLFTQEDFTLDRLEKICQFLNLELSDLFAMVKTSQKITQLTLEQEQTIVNDHKLLLVAICVVNYWNLTDILEYYDINYHECIQKLIFLDKLKIIEYYQKIISDLKSLVIFRGYLMVLFKNFFRKIYKTNF